MTNKSDSIGPGVIVTVLSVDNATTGGAHVVIKVGLVASH